MAELPESLGLAIAVALGIFLLGWYFVGNELMRRRAHRLALWAKRVIDPFGGRQSIRWLGGQAFRLEVDDPKAPFRSLSLTGLVESWDVPMVWAWNRFHGRRDMIVLQATLRSQPIFGLELFHPRSILAGDARGFARQEGWMESTLDEFVVAAAYAQTTLVTDLLSLLGEERARLLRLAVRRQGDHVILALNIPDPGSFNPADAARIMTRIAERLDKH